MGDSDSLSERHSTLTDNEFDLEHKVHPYSGAEQSTLSGSLRSPTYKVPRVPVPVFDPASVRRTSVPDAVERV